MSLYVLVFFLVLLAFINVLVSVYLYRRDDLDNMQKTFQILIVWLIPYAGAIGLWLFNSSNDEICKNKKEFGGGGNDSSMVSSSGSD